MTDPDLWRAGVWRSCPLYFLTIALMSYFTQSDLSALIPEDWLTEGLDDDANASAEAFSAVRSLVEAQINGILGQRYDVPFSAPSTALAEFLKAAACYLAAKVVYGRRGLADKYPFKDETRDAMERLNRIGRGDDPLSPKIEQANDNAVVISEPSRVYSTQSGF